ncbi:MAG: undecaprenyldiphospho-muramoylpentapeptide beta-N-acetylglucosaminyltransferase [Butyricicoccus sp.]|nr:undecaprenyldiphospho-muramoylpentapeptide beta-N-acetylglucosaminyltransferase [Butyricicoccus sp.]
MKLYITGGGTGGHVTPGLAIARYFQQKRPDTEVRFAGTPGGIESRLVPREGYPLDAIEITGLRRSMSPAAIGHNLNAVRQTLAAQSKAKKLLRQHKPDCVIGCGGYASFPIVSAAQKLGIPTVLLEVNALPGVVTKMLAKKAEKVLICFEEARDLLGGGDNIFMTGSPVRTEIMFADRAAARKKLGLTDSDRMVISFWGSMGAKYMNEHMADMLALEAEQGTSFRHVHATGSAAFETVKAMVQDKGVDLAQHPNIRLTDYIYDMADQMAAADLVICRAGAATIGELRALGRASIMVPSPYVAENHQEKNARAMEKAGACQVLLEKDSSGEKLLEMTAALLADDAKREDMAACAARLAALDAGEKIYQHILEAIG